ncbi:lysylphosphatidylglycerol synthase transmembrane domain-containing protein [Halorhabdus salina]|uniref:lysylphosphatidylglycerol synthase transmembrane domain-containing protein n=1 Tax=Halorhabdus salina TaxID=2750670 RepID=UPI0015EE61F5|nr:flippase-like domain-containing protein [Halorhabdus salina]
MGNAGGVPIIAYAFDRQARTGFNRSLAVVTIGDFLGLVSTLVLVTIGVGYVAVTVPGSRLVGTALVLVVLATVALLSVGVLLVYRQHVLKFLVLGVAHIFRGTFGRLSTGVERRLAPEPLSASVDRYFETVDTVRGDRRSLLIAFLLAFVGWTLFAVPLYTSAIAVGRPIPFGLVLFVVSVGGVATLVPLPGGLGGVEFAIAGLIVVTANVDPAVAGATVVLYRLSVYWLPVAIGLVAAVYSGISVGSFDDSVTRLDEIESDS